MLRREFRLVALGVRVVQKVPFCATEDDLQTIFRGKLQRLLLLNQEVHEFVPVPLGFRGHVTLVYVSLSHLLVVETELCLVPAWRPKRRCRTLVSVVVGGDLSSAVGDGQCWCFYAVLQLVVRRSGSFSVPVPQLQVAILILGLCSPGG